MEFKPFQKISRWNRDITITEKIDGTNAAITLTYEASNAPLTATVFTEVGPMYVYCQSRNRFVNQFDDNYGFARWVGENCLELSKLGVGTHFGEWWGYGIQRGYGQKEKKFTLFNTHRWQFAEVFPSCCSYVPILYTGPNSQSGIKRILDNLKGLGSVVAPGYMNPEGIVIHHSASNTLYKVTLENDDKPKSQV